MLHNKFDYEYDLIKPLNYFFSFHKLPLDEREEIKVDNLRNYFDSVFGYTDERDLKYKHLKDYKNDSKYHNNF